MKSQSSVKIMVSDDDKIVKKLDFLNSLWQSETWTRKMTSCQVDRNNICSDLLIFTYHWNGRDNFEQLIDATLQSAVNRYLNG